MMTKKKNINDEQRIKNAQLRMALRRGQLPYRFTDEQDRRYRQIVYEIGVETGQKFSVTKNGDEWTVDVKERREKKAIKE